MIRSTPFAVLILNLLLPSHISARAEQYAIYDSMATVPTLNVSPRWAVLGPFQIGTREAAWGSDPLEYYGGFPSLVQNDKDKFPSSIAKDGTVGWSAIDSQKVASSNYTANATLSVSFPEVDWSFLQLVYGWASTQYQAWARGEIVLTGDVSQNILVWSDHILEFAVDGQRHFGGDFFAFRKAPLVLKLKPGRHVIDLRLVRDVRAMGGIGVPSIDVELQFRIAREDLEVREGSILMPDVIEGKFGSPYGSVALTNTGATSIQIFGLYATDNATSVQLLAQDGVVGLEPGQTRPLPFRLGVLDANKRLLQFTVRYGERRVESFSPNVKKVRELLFSTKPHEESRYSPQKVTHLHPSGIVSYAILRPPSRKATCLPNIKAAPILLQFHGAGVEADNGIVAHSLDPLPDLCAWVLFPTGVTPWSADDWHTWGFSDVEAAIAAIPDWIKSNQWNEIGVDTNKWFVSGHSNGGQGTWYALAHRPDKIIAATPVSGYLSIQQYVPYQLWKSMDPRKRGVLESATSSYRHELLASNLKGIPIYQQHGGADDNVPAYHSKLMHLLISETGWASNYSELAGKGHWFETVMTTPGLQDFYLEQLKHGKLPSLANIDSFEIVVSNPGATGSKFGIRVLYLEDPGQLGKLRVSLNRETATWRFEPENIMVFEIKDTSDFASMSIHDSGSDRPVEFTAESSSRNREFRRSKNSGWKLGGDSSQDPRVRQTFQFGSLDAILRSNGPFTIAHGGPETYSVALQISRNFHQYFAADSEIVRSYAPVGRGRNGITVAIGLQLPPCSVADFPIRVSESTGRLQIQNPEGYWETPGGSRRPMAAVFLRPLPQDRLELVVWGASLDGVRQAARLVPMLTGTGQADFIIIGDDARWRGADAAYMGFFDAWWKVSRSSVLT